MVFGVSGVSGVPHQTDDDNGTFSPSLFDDQREKGSSWTTEFGVDRCIVGFVAVAVASFFSFMLDKIFIALFH